MPFSLKSGKPIRGRLRQIVRRQLRGSEKRLREGGDAAVHEARKAVKKVRAIGRLLHRADFDAPLKDKRRLQAIGRVLSTRRDSDAVIETFDRLRRRFPRRLSAQANTLIRRRLVRARTRIEEVALDHRSAERVADALRAVRRSAGRWRLPGIEPEDLPHLLKASYRDNRTAMTRAQETTRGLDLHRWRKRVKALWYQMRLLESLAPGLRAEIQRLSQLEAWLGDHHNLSVLRSTLADDPEMRRQAPAALSAITAMSTDVQKALRGKALALGGTLFGPQPKEFVRGLRRELLAISRRVGPPSPVRDRLALQP